MSRELQSQAVDYLEGLLEGFVAYDEHWVMTYINAAGERLLGRRREDVLGKTWQQAFPHAVGNPVDEMYQRVMRTRQPERMTYHYAHYGRWFEISASPVRSGGVAVYFRDATERAALQESEQRFRTLADSAPALIWVNGLQGAEFVNRGYLDFLGVDPPDIRGYDWAQFVHPDDRDRYVGAYLEALKRRSPFDAEFRFRRHDGEYRWMRSVGQPRAGADGELLGYSGITIDITERKRTEEALRKSEARKQAMFETALDCVISIDHEDRVVEFNPAAERTFGYRRADVMGRELAELIVPRRLREQHRQGMARYLASGEHRVLDRRLEMPAMRADGTEFPAELTVTRIPSDGPPLFTAYLRDITERRKAEGALKEADRRKDEFLATLSHELRNPLAPLRNALHLAKLTGEGGDTARPLHEMMERQVNHLIRLVDDLLEISRITRGAFELRKERLELAMVVRNALETSDPLVQAAGHRVALSLPEEPLWVDGDGVRLAQILSNVINNAAKYTPRGGEITVRASRDDGRAAVSVRDNGAGIPPATMARIFEMFNKGEGSSGLGVGLALSRRLAEMHGGTLEGRSEGVGKGAEFTLRLPLAARGTSRPATPQASSFLEKRRVLVVDDNRDAADSLGALLKFLGAEVQIAYDGAAALDAFEKRRPDVILLDLGMPGMDGYEVARRMRSRSKGERIPIVAVTGFGQEEDKRRSRDAGFDQYLTKPADIGALQALLASLQ